MPLPPDYEVRAAREDDLASLAAIELAAAGQFLSTGIRGAFLDEATSLADFREAHADGQLWVAAHRERCVGFAHAGVLDDGEPWLEEIDVHPDHGRRGLGRALVGCVIEWARSLGGRSLGLTTFRDVRWNAPFYRQLGFRDLDVADYSDAIRRILDDERRRGLPMEHRTVMRLTLATTSRTA